MIRIILFALFLQVLSSNHTCIINQDDVEQGFCHLQDVNLYVDVKCGLHYGALVSFSVVSSENEKNDNELLSCIRPSNQAWICPGSELMTGAQNKDVLGIRFTFNNSIFGGQYLRIKMCDNRKRTEHILLKACISGFSANAAFYGDSSVIKNCQHSSFDCSFSPIRIKSYGKDQEFGACYRNFCHGSRCRKLPNGIQCILPYEPDNRYQCVMDGAFFNISEPTMPENTLTSLESSDVPKTTQPTPPGSLAPTTLSHQYVTSTESHASKGTTMKTTEMSTSQGTSIPAPATSKTQGINGETRLLIKGNLPPIIATLLLFHIYYVYFIN